MIASLHPLMWAEKAVVQAVLDRTHQSGWRRWSVLAASSLTEKVVRYADRREPPKPVPSIDPATLDIVFIAGFWRSGTTLLHELMSLDPSTAAPSLVDLITPRLIDRYRATRRRILKRALPADRRVDRQPLGPDRPMEEDLAIAQMGGPSCFLGAYFPSQREEYYSEALFFDGGRTNAREAWCRNHRSIVAALGARYPGRRLILKSPVNSTHLTLLKEMYPRARFVRIDRPAVDACRSMKRLLDDGMLSFEGRPAPTRLEDIWALHDRFMTVMNAEWEALPKACKVAIRYVDLTADPIASLRHIWMSLGERWTPDRRDRAVRFWETEARKNSPPSSGGAGHGQAPAAHAPAGVSLPAAAT